MKEKYISVEVQGKKILDEEHGTLDKMYAKVNVGSQEEFLKIYLNSLDDLISLDNKMFQILLIVLRRARFIDKEDALGNEFFNNDSFKEEVRKKIDPGYSDNTINKYVSLLAQQHMLLRVNKGSYILNPRYFAKGKITAKTRMELIVQYNG